MTFTAIVSSFFAGIKVYASPSLFPLIPAYLLFIGSIYCKELKKTNAPELNLFFKTFIFTTGFSLIFIIQRVFSSVMDNSFSQQSHYLSIIAGIVILLYGFHFIFDFIKILKINEKIYITKIPAGIIGFFLLGIAFGTAWTPCISPFVGSILISTNTFGTSFQRIFLLCIFTIGIAIPFLVSGLLFSIFSKYMKKTIPYTNMIMKINGGFLILLGTLTLFGSTGYLNETFITLSFGLEYWSQKQPAGPLIVFGILFLIPSVLIVIFYIRKIKVQKNNILMPVRISLFSLFFTLSILSFTGVIDIVELLYYWFTFSGI